MKIVKASTFVSLIAVLISGCDDGLKSHDCPESEDRPHETASILNKSLLDLKYYISGRAFFSIRGEKQHLMFEAFRPDGRWVGVFDGIDFTQRNGYWTVENSRLGRGYICVVFDKSPYQSSSGRRDCREAIIVDHDMMMIESFDVKSLLHRVESRDVDLEIYFNQKGK